MNIGYRDRVIIPDQYNTGCYLPSALVSAKEKFPPKGSYAGYSGYLSVKEIAQNGGSYLFEDIWFKGQINLRSDNMTDVLHFKNCRFSGVYAWRESKQKWEWSAYALERLGEWTDNNGIIFENCEFYDFNSACVQPISRMHFIRCYIHDIQGDGCKAFSEGGYEDCYITHLGLGAGSHSDGLQFATQVNNFYFKNCRIDNPKTNDNVSNVGIFVGMSEGSLTNAYIKDNVILMGGKGMAVSASTDKGYSVTNLDGENNTVGYNCQFSFYTCASSVPECQNWIEEGKIARQDKLFVSSVYKGANDKIKVHATNYTNSARTLILVTDEETRTFTVPACYDYNSGKTHPISDFPLNIEYEVEGEWVVAYDTSVSEENQIRASYATVKELFTDIADAIRSKTGSNELIARVDIPNIINNTLAVNPIPKPASPSDIVVSGITRSGNLLERWDRFLWLDEAITFDADTDYVIECDMTMAIEWQYYNHYISLSRCFTGNWVVGLQYLPSGIFKASGSETWSGHLAIMFRIIGSGHSVSDLLNFDINNATVGAWEATNGRVYKVTA